MSDKTFSPCPPFLTLALPQGRGIFLMSSIKRASPIACPVITCSCLNEQKVVDCTLFVELFGSVAQWEESF